MLEDKISIIMGIYNCEDTLSEAIKSIILQTYDNWELIICDDGSTDGTYSVALDYKNRYSDKIILLKNEQNLGLNKTLNICLKQATGKYIARMDGDDISLPNRFEKELAAFEKNPDISIVSCQMVYFDEKGDFGQSALKEYPIAKDLIYGTVHCHAPAMILKSALDYVGGYSEKKEHLRVEDYQLWLKLYSQGYKGYNIPEVLYKMRDSRDAVSRRKYAYRVNNYKLKCAIVKELKLSPIYYIFAIRPLLVGLLPKDIYSFLHKKKQDR